MAETEQIEITCDQDGRLRRVPLGDLHRFQGMLKTLSVGEYDKLKASIIKYGFFVPVFVWKNRILDGHQRLFVIEKEGWELAGGVPVVDIEAETETEAAEKLLILSSTYGKVEPQGLYEFTQTHDISLAEFDLPDLPDFDLESFKDEFYDEEEGDEGAADEVPDAPEVPISQTGDLWLLGDHRLLCGDSTSGEDVARLMDGVKAGVMVTSPPYFNQRQYSHWDDYDDYLKFAEQAIETATAAMAANSIMAVNIGSNEPDKRWMPSDYYNILSEKNWRFQEAIAWVKSAAVWSIPRSMHIEKGHYFPALKWEMILVAGRGDHPKFDIKDKKDVREFDENVWTIPVVSGQTQTQTGHPAMFPVEIPLRVITAYSLPGDLIFEPFAGSGSTIIASEKKKRAARGLEIDPQYCDVAVLRWQDYTGQEAKLEGDGRTFGEVAEERGVASVAA